MTCSKCGSDRIVRPAKILDFAPYSDGPLRLAVDAAPEAMIFTERSYFDLEASVCGSCGFTELYAQQPGMIWDIHQEAQAKQKPPVE